ncbi:isocyanide synthase family protein [Thiotrichales bacterium 19S3-7]|nr:isocyanide synthase family protein [Thiotrichales bacterium 19S3-7]MCF6801954.1 isocyanide synthase family protein [Thiotrichales bacterium 19S3-11]
MPNITSAVNQNEPIELVLPAFPGKSPNPYKVLGYLPDYAEVISLKFLDDLCQSIKEFYAPGMNITICSDGRVFSDIIGMNEAHVTNYQIQLENLIKSMSLDTIKIFNLDYLYTNVDFIEMRYQLIKEYAEPLASIQQKIRLGAEASSNLENQALNQLYKGITRFLFEDLKYPGQLKTNSARQKEAKAKAYKVIQRSDAWSHLIKAYFPNAVRLSIHPHPCGSQKLGIKLIADEIWMTPWHGVALEHNNKYSLVKRSQAESLGAKLVYFPNGQPSHYQL